MKRKTKKQKKNDRWRLAITVMVIYLFPLSYAYFSQPTTIILTAPKVEMQEAIAAEVEPEQALQPVDVALEQIPHESPKTADIIKYLYEEAPKHGIDPDKVAHTIYCESMFYNVQSAVVVNGVREPSYGLAQIHIPSHKNITVEQALTPTFAIDWMLTNWDGEKWYGYDRATDTCTNSIIGYWITP